MKLHRLLTPLLAWAALASCAQTPPASAPASAPPPAPAPAQVAELASKRLAHELRTLIGPAACSADAQCRTLPVGHKACGGPAGYLAWSTEGTDAERLAALAVRQAEAHKLEVEASGMQSNCALIPNPGAACVAGRCQLATSASAR